MTGTENRPQAAPSDVAPGRAARPRQREFRVLLISDGTLGHYRQSEGIVAALGRAAGVTVTRLELSNRFPFPKALLPRLARVLSPQSYLHWIHGIDPSALEKADVIVSTAGPTLGANVALAKVWGAANFYSGTTRGLPLSGFRLVLSPYPSAAGPPNIFVGPKPTPFDPDPVPPPRPIRAPQDLRGARVSLLIGGPIPQADFGPADWASLAVLLESLVTVWGCRVTVVTSRRTPAVAYEAVLPLAGRSPIALKVIDFRTAGPGSIEAAFDCDLVLVTSDSMSMMTEAALSRRPAIALAPRNVQPCPDDEGVAALVEARWLAVSPLATTDAARLAEAAAALRPMTDNHLDVLAARLLAALDAPPALTRP
jgi:hypothetical protein